MAQTDPGTDPNEELVSTPSSTDSEDTAPDSDTQSSAASEAGGRTAEEGSRAPNDPAEGA